MEAPPNHHASVAPPAAVQPPRPTAAAPSWLDTLMPGVGPGQAVFAGGIGVACVGVAMGLARSSSRAVATALRRSLTTTLEVTSKDAAYPWVLHWLKRRELHGGARARHVSVTTLVSASTASGTGVGSSARSSSSSAAEDHDDDDEDAMFELVPAPGRHLVRFRGCPILVERAREYSTVNTSSGTPWERLTLTAPRFLDENGRLFRSLLRSARDACEAARDADALTLYTCWGTEWRAFGQPRRKRPLASVVLAEGLARAIVEDVRDWQRSLDWYRRRGVPYRRGVLLHGPPGGGKTSFVVALAGHLDLDVCVLSLSDDGLTDDRLALALANVPPRALVLLEDLDAAFVSRERAAFDNSRGSQGGVNLLTLSGLLNALDGAAATEGRLLFATTNHLDRLDPAILRPGRIDLVHLVDYATEAQAATLFDAFFRDDVVVVPPGAPDSLEHDEAARIFARRAVAATLEAAGRAPSMAELQAFLIERKHDPGAAVDEAHLVADVALARVVGPRAPPGAATAGGGEELPRQRVSRGRRVLTPEEVDKLPWNPQPGWEEMVGKIVPPAP